MCFASIALAEEAQTPVKEKQCPVMLTDSQLDEVVAAGGPNGEAWGYESMAKSYQLTFVPAELQEQATIHSV